MHRVVIAVASIAACYKPSNLVECTVACEDAAAPTDAVTDATDCVGTGFVRPCGVIVSPGTETLVGGFDTGTQLLCNVIAQGPDQPDLCVVAKDTIDVQGSFRASGTRPLVLVGRLINIAGLDVSSRRDEIVIGPGSCRTAPTAGQNGKADSDGVTTFGGGGAGGSFQGTGGTGGEGFVAAPDVQGGLPLLPAMPTFAIGGCSGGTGFATTAAAFGRPGEGGGVAYVIATEQITVAGTIAACGAGGHRPNGVNAGGGGGGAGGLIVLDAPKVVVSASSHLVASGGGGAAGGSQTAGGVDGKDPDPRAASLMGVTGRGGNAIQTTVGDGGDGSTELTANGADAGDGNQGGGGGGGGAAGFIMVYATDRQIDSSFILPAPMLMSPL